MRRADHDALGLLFGAAAIALLAAQTNRRVSIGEVLGGAAAGYLGSRIPDVLEPAHHPNHRGPVHSVATLALVGHQLAPLAARANRLALANAEREGDPLLRFLKQFAAGLGVGAAAGFTSHLAADATTPKSLPLLRL